MDLDNVLLDAPPVGRPELAHGALELLLGVPGLDVPPEEHEAVGPVAAHGAGVAGLAVAGGVVIGHLPGDASGELALGTAQGGGLGSVFKPRRS